MYFLTQVVVMGDIMWWRLINSSIYIFVKCSPRFGKKLPQRMRNGSILKKIGVLFLHLTLLCFGSPLVQVLSRQFRGCPADSLWPVYPLYRHWAALCLILLQRLHLIDSLLWYFAVGMLTFSVFLFHRQALMDCQLLDSIIPRYIWHTL